MRINPLFNQKINQWVLFLIPITFMMVSPWPISELSLWISYGERLWSDWNFLYQDNVTVLPTDNNVTSSWLISLLYFGLYRLGGIYLVSHFHHLTLVFILAILYRNTIFRNPWPWPWQERLSIYAVWLGSGAYFALRPALLAFIPLIFSFQICERRASLRQDFQTKDWIQLILLQIGWVNLHGSFILLPLIVGWVLLMSRKFFSKQFFGFFGLLVATLISPFGFSIYEYVFKTKEYSQFLGIDEWVSAFSWSYPLQFACYWALLVFIIFFTIRSIRRGQRIWESPMLPLVLLPLFGLRLSTFAFSILPIFLFYRAGLFKTRREDIFKSSPWGPGLAFTLILLFMVAGSPYFKHKFQALLPTHLQSRFDEPTVFAIAARINENPQKCLLLNDFNVGGFLMLNTRNPLLMDGRVTPYTKDAMVRYLSFMKAEQLETLIQDFNPCFAVLPRHTSGTLIEALINKYEFKNLGSENGYILLEKEFKK